MPWKETYTGRRVDFTNPDPDSICIEDIAHSLARTCRYGGHCHTEGIWSVAEHSLVVEYYLDEHFRIYRLRLLGLLHDATEAYIGDLPPMAKELLPEYQRWEANCERAILKAFIIWPHGLGERERVKEADRAALAAEAAAFMASKGVDWECNTASGNLPYIEPDKYTCQAIEDAFICRFRILMRACAIPLPPAVTPLGLEDAEDLAEIGRREGEEVIPIGSLRTQLGP